jgi:hypothetical protein
MLRKQREQLKQKLGVVPELGKSKLQRAQERKSAKYRLDIDLGGDLTHLGCSLRRRSWFF